MIPQDFQFGLWQPIYLIFLILLFAYLLKRLFFYRQKVISIFAAFQQPAKLGIARSNLIYFLKGCSFLLAFLFAILALMNPFGNGHYPEGLLKKSDYNYRLKDHDLIFLIDASSSMAIKNNLNGKTNLNTAKEIADELLSRLRGESAALYAFTSVATQLSPATMDTLFVRLMLRDIAINEGNVAGTDFLKTLEKVAKNHFNDKSQKLLTLIILSDGGDTDMQSLQGVEKEKRIEFISHLVKNATDLNLRVYSIGIGSSQNEKIPDVSYKGEAVYSKLDGLLLKQLSKEGRGHYYQADEKTAVQIAQEIIKDYSQDELFFKEGMTKEQAKESLVYTFYFQIPLGLSLLFLSFYLFFPNSLKSKILKNSIFILLFLLAGKLQGTVEEQMKLASDFMEAGQSEEAETLYEKLADEKLSSYQKTVLSYNLGALYLTQKKFNEAITQFESISLKESPHFYLNYRIMSNLSFAKFLEAKKLLESEPNHENSQDELEKVYYLLKSSQKELSLAKQAECELKKIKGAPNCNESNSSLESFSQVLSKKLNKVLKQLKTSPHEISSEELFEKRAEEIYEKALALHPANVEELNKILQYTIDETLLTLRRTRALRQEEDLSNREKPETPLDLKKSGLENVQKKALELAKKYFDLTPSFQSQAYREGPQDGFSSENLPFFHQGFEALVQALFFTPNDLEKSGLNQEKAIKYFKLALNKPKENKNNESKNNPIEVKKEETKLNEREDPLKLLQQMHSDDKKLKVKTTIRLEEVERPW